MKEASNTDSVSPCQATDITSIFLDPETGAVYQDWMVVDAVRRNRSRVANSLFSARIREFFSGRGEQPICPTRKTTEFQCFNWSFGNSSGKSGGNKAGN
jgi:hypothetical protein